MSDFGNQKINLLKKQVLSKVTQEDILFIKQQLGREPRGILEISARCKSGHPLVVKTKPVLVESEKLEVKSDKKIFPTLYYLVCGSVIDKVSGLESEGFIAKLQHRIDNDQRFRVHFLEAQKKYRYERNLLIGPKNRLGESQKESLEGGVGGVKKLDRVKCLHCQLAHYIVTGANVVGEEVAKKAGISC